MIFFSVFSFLDFLIHFILFRPKGSKQDISACKPVLSLQITTFENQDILPEKSHLNCRNDYGKWYPGGARTFQEGIRTYRAAIE
jgi:hypothetical protein